MTVVKNYKGKHTHSLSGLAIIVMQAGSSNQLIEEGLDKTNCVEDKLINTLFKQHYQNINIDSVSNYYT